MMHVKMALAQAWATTRRYLGSIMTATAAFIVYGFSLAISAEMPEVSILLGTSALSLAFCTGSLFAIAYLLDD